MSSSDQPLGRLQAAISDETQVDWAAVLLAVKDIELCYKDACCVALEDLFKVVEIAERVGSQLNIIANALRLTPSGEPLGKLQAAISDETQVDWASVLLAVKDIELCYKDACYVAPEDLFKVVEIAERVGSQLNIIANALRLTPSGDAAVIS